MKNWYKQNRRNLAKPLDRDFKEQLAFGLPMGVFGLLIVMHYMEPVARAINILLFDR